MALQYTTGSGNWKTYLVQGSPYVTIEYEFATPTIRAMSTFKNVACPGDETSESGNDEADFSDDFSDDDDNGNDNQRRLLGVCGASVSRNWNGRRHCSLDYDLSQENLICRVSIIALYSED